MMKFENKGKWLKESFGSNMNDEVNAEEKLDEMTEEEMDELFEEDIDEVDDEEQINEVRYIDPNNLDRYNPDEIEEVTTASGEKKYKRKQGVSTSANEPAEKKTEEPDRLSTAIERLDNSKILDTDSDDFKFILNNLPTDPLAREAKLIEIGNKYDDEQLRRKNIENLLLKSPFTVNDKMAKAMGLNVRHDINDVHSTDKKLNAIIDNLDFESKTIKSKELPSKLPNDFDNKVSKFKFNSHGHPHIWDIREFVETEPAFGDMAYDEFKKTLLDYGIATSRKNDSLYGLSDEDFEELYNTVKDN